MHPTDLDRGLPALLHPRPGRTGSLEPPFGRILVEAAMETTGGLAVVAELDDAVVGYAVGVPVDQEDRLDRRVLRHLVRGAARRRRAPRDDRSTAFVRQSIRQMIPWFGRSSATRPRGAARSASWDRFVLLGLEVSPDRARSGIAEQLLREVVDRVAASGYTGIEVAPGGSDRWPWSAARAAGWAEADRSVGDRIVWCPAPPEADTAAASEPLVSVILPAYDRVRPDELEAAARSMLEQSHRSVELLIGLDGVAEGPLRERAAELEAADPRVRVISMPKQEGLGAVLNQLIAHATGDLVARMDADDESMPSRLEHQVAFLRQHPRVMVVGTFADEVDSDGAIVFTKHLPITPHDTARFLVRRDPLIHPTVMFRREVLERLGGYRTRPLYLEDTELWTRMAIDGMAMANLPERLLRFRVTPALYESRRRGWDYALQEARLRLSYRRQAGLPVWTSVFPLALLGLRLMPPAVLRVAYSVLRR